MFELTLIETLKKPLSATWLFIFGERSSQPRIFSIQRKKETCECPYFNVHLRSEEKQNYKEVENILPSGSFCFARRETAEAKFSITISVLNFVFFSFCRTQVYQNSDAGGCLYSLLTLIRHQPSQSPSSRCSF